MALIATTAIQKFAPSHPAIAYLEGLFDEDDFIFVQLIHSTRTHTVKDSKTGKERTSKEVKLLPLVSVRQAATPDYIASLEAFQADGWNVYVCMNPFPQGTTTRTERLIKDVRNLFLDVDKTKGEGANALQLIKTAVASKLIPAPNSVLESSPGNYHVAWNVDGFTWDEAKAALPALASMLGGDMAAIDLHRVLRLPGTQNLKYADKFICHLLSDSFGEEPYTKDDFKISLRVAKSKSGNPVASEELQKIADYIEDNAQEAKFELGSRDEYNGGFKWIVECPWVSVHTTGTKDALIMLLEDGRPQFNCFHGHCSDRGWSDIRKMWETAVGHPQRFGDDKSGQVLIGPNKVPAGSATSVESPAVPIDSETMRNRAKEIFASAQARIEDNDPCITVQGALAELRKLECLDFRFPRELTDKTYWGLIGDFVNIALPTTVASREMLLYQSLPVFGSSLGKKSFVPFGADRHYAVPWTLTIASTAQGKGSVKNIVLAAARMLDDYFSKNGIKGNVASGEALVRVCAGTGMANAVTRLVWIMPEMSLLFNAMDRDGSVLSQMLRQAYDFDLIENERSSKKNSVIATNYVLGMMGTITPRELREAMGEINWSNGVANRFLWNIGSRTKKLKTSRTIPDFTEWALRFQKILGLDMHNEETGGQAFDYSPDGLDCWNAWVDSLPEDDDESNFGLSQARSKPNCLRVAALYAQLDERRLEGWKLAVEPRHIEAGIEIVQRSAESVAWYLNSGSSPKATQDWSDEDLAKLITAAAKKVSETGKGEMTSTELNRLFSHKSPEQRDALCIRAKMRLETRPPEHGGSPARVWMF